MSIGAYSVDSIPGTSCSNALGGAVVNNDSQSSYTDPDGTSHTSYNVSQSSDSIRYRLAAGGTTVTVTCTPDASVTASSETSASVRYNVTITPIQITLDGAIGPIGTQRCLTGQQITAHLSIAPDVGSGYNWSISGGMPFAAYVPTLNSAVVVLLSSDTLLSATPSALFAKDETVLVSCSTTVHGLPITAFAPLTMDRPNSTFTSTIGVVALVDGGADKKDALKLVAGVNPDLTLDSGIQTIRSVRLPTEYAPEGDGTTYVTQLVTPERTRIAENGDYLQGPWNGHQGLDTEIVYQSLTASAFAGGQIYTPVTDGPGFEGGPNFRAAMVTSEEFVDFLMFTPPSTSTGFAAPVTLQTVGWLWGGKATRSSLVPYSYLLDPSYATTQGQGTISVGQPVSSVQHTGSSIDPPPY